MFITFISMAKAGKYPMTIQDLKKEVTEINDEMLRLFIRHLEIVKEIGEVKKAEGKTIYDRKAEEEILEKAAANSPQDMQNYSIEFFRSMINLGKEYFKDVK